MLLLIFRQVLHAENKVPPVKNRVKGEISTSRRFAVKENESPLARTGQDAGDVGESFMLRGITFVFKMTDAQQAALNQLLLDQQTRSSPDYHKWLTPEQYAARFGASQDDAQKVKTWLEREGFTFVQTARSRARISFDGSAERVNRVFLTPIHRYQIGGQMHYANVSAPFLPSQLQELVSAVRGLNDFHPKARAVRSRQAGTNTTAHFTSSISGAHFLAPEDFAVIYNVRSLYNAGIDGTGQKIAIAGQTDIDLKDIDAFRSAAGLPANEPLVVLYGADPGTNTNDLGEADLDIEWAGAVARNATIVYANSTDVFNSAIHAIDDNLAPVLSLTYGTCEANVSAAEMSTLTAAFQQANAQGITVIAASGDFGAADCDEPTDSKQVVASATHGLSIDVPSDIPYVTALGGSTLTEGTGTYWNTINDANGGSALSYIPETVWNDTSTTAGIAASGGGASKLFTKPVWQTGENVPNDGFRDTPDVSLSASANHDGYLMCSGGDCVNGFRDTDNTVDLAGGTSVAAPTFAGIIALLNQHSDTTQGNINFILYPLAASSTDAFHDITQGDNKAPCTLGSTDCVSGGSIGYSAGPGYDQATGLGSVDAANLVNEWSTVSAKTQSGGGTPDFTFTLSPSSLALTKGTVGTASVAISPLNGFNGPVAFTCQVPTSLGNVSCAVSNNIVGSGSGTVTITVPLNSALVRLRTVNGSGRMQFALIASASLLGLAMFMYAGARRLRPAAFAGLAAAGLLVISGCDDGNGGSSEKSGSVTVLASSGTLQHSAAISVTVN
jgi:subtilase family serine protease